MSYNEIKFSNPRDAATIENWPHGRNKRVTATFTVERTNRGERVSRVTTGKPKKTTYYSRVAIVDGDDGKLYIVCKSHGMVTIYPGTLRYPETYGQLSQSPAALRCFKNITELLDELKAKTCNCPMPGVMTNVDCPVHNSDNDSLVEILKANRVNYAKATDHVKAVNRAIGEHKLGPSDYREAVNE